MRVCINIIVNAFDAMPNGGTFTISSKEVNDKIEISFSDTGVGMSKENIKKISTPFFTTKAKGMGLGLSISKRLLEAHNGKLHVSSELGQGTTFTITIPIKIVQKQKKEIVYSC